MTAVECAFSLHVFNSHTNLFSITWKVIVGQGWLREDIWWGWLRLDEVWWSWVSSGELGCDIVWTGKVEWGWMIIGDVWPEEVGWGWVRLGDVRWGWLRKKRVEEVGIPWLGKAQLGLLVVVYTDGEIAIQVLIVPLLDKRFISAMWIIQSIWDW